MVESEHVLETEGLTKRFGRAVAVDHLDLRVPTGSVFAFLGRNGAGKTTTIQMLLNLLPRTAGTASIFGLDCRRHHLEIKRRTGYVAEAQHMYDWMTVAQILWFCSGFYPTWDHAFAEHVRQELELPLEQKLGDMSRGTQAKVALLLAMAYKPELLILDEPTAGLDVVVRRDFLEGVVELSREEGRTIFFSSHLVHEVERVADWVGLIHQGLLLRCCPLTQLKNEVKRVVARFSIPPPSVDCKGMIRREKIGLEWHLTVDGYNEAVLGELKQQGAADVRVEDLSLEDIVVVLLGNYRPDAIVATG